MGSKTHPRVLARLKRKKRIRARVTGTADRPRLTVYRSAKHIYAQLIDDTAGVTLAAASTLSPEFKNLEEEVKGKEGAAQMVGQLVAQKALEKGIKKAVFDRNGFIYHGRVRALADGARAAGLEF
ncbi:large subunit ribosomal protein L18 [Desulfacinum hydrothermale DSM 13146]|uniref:Large ribosomal subunit protein uL18 n=1 Tax=Desulfacinum hydrothermale DSM 13146 TaxID=1121390 RepID=A0A1W1XQF1_9BACT|nr:50S ribosomal protein L18 [Desulfacinum hydrothermale]SMC26126.1 large subunit ribosomal protein L18 [Desulfacinum hydrothermale DSM 13146]